MPKLLKAKGSTSVILEIVVQDSSSTTGAGLTGLTNGSSGLTCYYHRNTASSATAVTLASMTVGTFTSSGFKEVDATNMPGVYQLCLPDAAYASGADSVVALLKGATNMAPLPIEIQLTGIDVADAVRGGMTALPNAAAEAAGGLYTRGTGAGQINQDANGRIDANAKAWIGGTIPAVNVTGVPKVDVVDWLGNAPNALISGRVDANAQAVGDKSGYSLSSAGVQAIWDALTSALTTAGSIGKRIADNLDAAISSRSTYAGGDTSGTTTLLSRLTSGRATNLDRLDAAITSRPDAIGVAYAVWDEPRVDHTTSGTFGESVAGVATGVALTTSERNSVADALLDRANAVETSLTLRQALRLIAAAVAGKVSGAATTTVTIRNAVADNKARITATVDSDGNRSAVTTDVT